MKITSQIKKFSLALFLLLVIGISFTMRHVLRPTEATYHGKTLYQWLEGFGPVSQAEVELAAKGVRQISGAWVPGNVIELDYPSSDQMVEAGNAIRAFGTNSIPCLLRLAGTRDSGLKRFLLKSRLPERLLRPLRLMGAFNRYASRSLTEPRMVMMGFYSLGARAAPAAPGLVRVIQASDNDNATLGAILSLDYIEAPLNVAGPALVENLSDRNPLVRETSATVLSRLFYPRDHTTNECGVICCRLRSEEEVRSTVNAIIRILADPKSNTVGTIQLLQGLVMASQFGCGEAAIPAVSPYLNSGNPKIQAAAKEALKVLSLRPPHTPPI